MDTAITTEPALDDTLDESTGECRFSPAVRLYLVRALSYVCNHFLLTEPEEPAVGRSLRRLANMLGVRTTSETHATLPQLVTAFERATAAEEAKVGVTSDDHTSRMAKSLAAALGLGVTDAALLDLAFQASLSIHLRRGMNMLDTVDDHDAAKLFGAMLRIDWMDILQCLHRDNPFRRMSRSEIAMMSCHPADFIALPPHIYAVLRKPGCQSDDILALFVRPSPPPKLSLEDFRDAGPMVDLMVRYLRTALDSGGAAVNILLYGAPGTGKTELVRATAKALDATLREVPSTDDDKDPMPAWRRITAYSATQETLRHMQRSMVLFDEVEDVFPHEHAAGSSLFSRPRRSPDRNKGWMTGILEGNLRPCVWVSNAIDQIDPAYIRRFDLVVELRGPDRHARDRLVDTLFRDLPLPDASLATIKDQPHLTPGHLERMAKVLAALAPPSRDEGARILSLLQVETAKSLQVAPPKPRCDRLPYRTDCVNAGCDLDAMVEALGRIPSARLCLYGPPGTGKTEWARQLAAGLRKRLLVQRASDLLNMHVGETEKAIRTVFDDAASDGAILLIDEADSLLYSRDLASKSWEVTMVNEMLTAMESFDGIFVASTNLMDRLDPASARRFDFKVRFEALAPAQSAALFADLLATLKMPTTAVPDATWTRLRGLTPGDFANVYRQARLFPARHDAESLLNLLETELRFRPEALAGRRIGFV